MPLYARFFAAKKLAKTLRSHVGSLTDADVSPVVNVYRQALELHLGRQREFRCQGVESLDDFKLSVAAVNAVNPGAYSYRCCVHDNAPFDVGEFCRKMDALASEWDLRSGALPESVHLIESVSFTNDFLIILP